MKKLLCFLLLFPFTLFAQDMSAILSVLENPAAATNTNPKECPEEPVTPANACENLSEAVCRIRNNQEGLNAMARRFRNSPTQMFGEQEIPTLAAVTEIENDYWSRATMTRDELRNLFNEVKTNLRAIVLANADIDSQKKVEMVQKLEQTNFMLGTEYIAYKRANPAPGDSPEIAEQKGIRNYDRHCGNGIELAAYNQPGENQNTVILCPGLLQSLEDFKRNKREMMNALSFTLGHEIGHSFHSELIPEVYESMGSCYERMNGTSEVRRAPATLDNLKAVVSGKDVQHSGQESFWQSKGEEISADFWGTQILSQRLQNENLQGEDALRTIAVATDEFCNFPEDDHYQSGRDRIDQTISRHPQIRQQLGCQPPTREAPVCTMAGARYDIRR